LCDVDDVLANYKQGFIAAVNASGVRQLKPDHVFTDWDLSKSLGLTEEEDDEVYMLINQPGFAQNLAPLPGAVDGVRKIMEIADVLFVTSPLKTSPTWGYDRMHWLQKYFGEELGKKVVSTAEKHAIDGDFLCDDKPDHVVQWQAEHPRGRAILWITPQNMRMAPRDVFGLASWGMVYAVVEGLAKLMKAAR
jgi:5'(3')-deoxyribonucleotidase